MANGVPLDKLQRLDTLLFYKFNHFFDRRTKQASIWISRTGDGYLYFLIAVLLYSFEPISGASFFIATLIAFGIEVPCYLLLKHLFKRNRPFNKLANFSAHIAPSDKFSMPSGHTAAAFLFAFMVLHFYPQLALLTFLWASLVGLARVVLGVHYPGDILAGAVLGYASSQLALLMFVA